MTGYYDVVLGLIPLALVGITGALVLAGVGLTTAVPLAATVAVGLVGHALFVRSPTDDTGTIRPERARERSPVNAD
jgi:hypothetical protein